MSSLIAKLSFIAINDVFKLPTDSEIPDSWVDIEVNVSELGLVTQSGKVVWGKYAQVTNNPELDGCINAVLLV